MSINDLVSYNMARARKERGWTQDEVAEKLRKRTGRSSWTNVTVSAAERAHVTGRTRQFDADLLVALAQVFDRPVTYFFTPPPADRDDGETVFQSESVGEVDVPTISAKALDAVVSPQPLKALSSIDSMSKDDFRAMFDVPEFRARITKEYVESNKNEILQTIRQTAIEQSEKMFAQKLRQPAEEAAKRLDMARQILEDARQHAAKVDEQSVELAQLIDTITGDHPDDDRLGQEVGKWLIRNIAGDDEFVTLKEHYPAGFFSIVFHELMSRFTQAKEEVGRMHDKDQESSSTAIGR